MKLSKSINSYNTDEFKATLKSEIQSLNAEQLPLQKGLSLSSHISKTPFHAIILNINEDETSIKVKCGIFYTGIIAGCSCSDDPSPTDEQNEYCELEFIINKANAETKVELLN